MQRVLVTGASGFVGGHVVHALRAHGFEVRCLVRRTSRTDFLNPSAFELAFGDILDPQSLGKALDGVDAVVHCAGSTHAASRREYFQINEEGTRNMLAACSLGRSRIARFIHISSLAAIGPAADGRPVTEDSPPHPINAYGESKLASQRVAEFFMKDLPLTIILPPAVYGPGDDGFLPYFKLVSRGLIFLPGREVRCLSLLYARDLAEAVIVVLGNDKTIGKAYFVEDGSAHTWTSVAEAVGRAMGRRPRKVTLPVALIRGMGRIGDLCGRLGVKSSLLSSQKVREFLQPAWICSSRRFLDESTFRPRFSLESGIRETLAWYQEHRWL